MICRCSPSPPNARLDIRYAYWTVPCALAPIARPYMAPAPTCELCAVFRNCIGARVLGPNHSNLTFSTFTAAIDDSIALRATVQTHRSFEPRHAQTRPKRTSGNPRKERTSWKH